MDWRQKIPTIKPYRPPLVETSFQLLGNGRDLFESASQGLKLGVEKGGRGRLIGQTKGGMNTKLHAVTDTGGRPIRFFITAGQVSGYTGAMALLGDLPDAEWLLGDRGYDADWLREALIERGTRPCILGRKSRKKAVRYDKRRTDAATVPLGTLRCDAQSGNDRTDVWQAKRLAADLNPL